jgi:hypothetical protein
MFEGTRCDRRRFLGTAAMTMAAARLGPIGAADAQPSTTKPAAVPTIKPGTHTSFGALQQIDAGVLKKRRGPLPKLSSTLMVIDLRSHTIPTPARGAAATCVTNRSIDDDNNEGGADK